MLGQVLKNRGFFYVGESRKGRPLNRCFSAAYGSGHTDAKPMMKVFFQGSGQGLVLEFNEEFARDIINVLEAGLSQLGKQQ